MTGLKRYPINGAFATAAHRTHSIILSDGNALI